MNTILEPFRIKSVEPNYFNTKEERLNILENTFYNPFLIHSTDVLIDLICKEGKHPAIAAPFKGNMDTGALTKFITEKETRHIPLCIITVTNNFDGGHPVSMQISGR